MQETDGQLEFVENLDLNKHCGVTIAPSGLPCLRSLACKSHSLASKRAVIGRDRDFDALLGDYMKAHPSKGTAAIRLIFKQASSQIRDRKRVTAGRGDRGHGFDCQRTKKKEIKGSANVN